MPLRRAAIIGAGPCGLVSARYAVLNDFQVEIFDRRDVIGGRWSPSTTSQAPFLHESSGTQYAAGLCAFSDFQPQADPRKPMSKAEVSEYLFSYAKTHGLDQLTKLNADVVDVRRHADYEQNGMWRIKYEWNGETHQDDFDIVLVCTGTKQRPWRPNKFRHEHMFQVLHTALSKPLLQGRISHAISFKSADAFTDKTVVLVGFGNSAASIARAVAPVAKKTYIAARRGEWTWKQLDSSGQSFDVLYNSRVRYGLRCLIPRCFRNFAWERQSQLPQLEHPKHRFLATLPVYDDELEALVGSGRLQIEDNLVSFAEKNVEFESGTVVENVDEVMFCTGYEFDFKLIEDGLLVVVNDNDFQMYLHMYPVNLREQATLACIGFLQPQLGSIWPLAELQARLFFEVLNKRLLLPSVFDMRSDAEWRRCCINLNFLRTRRHTHIEDFVGFSKELSGLIGAQPPIARLLLDLPLAWHYFTGPLTAYQHRLSGPDAWSGARQAVISTSQQVPSCLWVKFAYPAVLIILLAFVLKLVFN